MSGTCMESTAGMEPNWARVPPHVPTYPNPPAYFRYKLNIKLILYTHLHINKVFL